MKRIFIYIFIVISFMGCHQANLEDRAVELWAYLPDVQMLEKSRAYMTEDFYAVLDTLLYRLPSHEAMDHAYNYWFTTDDGSLLSASPSEVEGICQRDADHAEATICGHHLSMERVKNQWLISDFDGRKEDGIRYISNNRKEQAVREAISAYLLREVAPLYKQGDICIPTLQMVYETDSCVWGDYLVLWYQVAGDSLEFVSGGIHPGVMRLHIDANGKPQVTQFEQVEDGARFESSAKRLFGEHFDMFMNIHSNESVREAVRLEQTNEYLKNHGLEYIIRPL